MSVYRSFQLGKKGSCSSVPSMALMPAFTVQSVLQSTLCKESSSPQSKTGSMPEVKFLSLKEYDAICCIFLKGKEKTTTDISFQVSIPLIINRKGAAIPIKEKVSLTKQGSQAASPYSPTLKK